MYALSKMKPIVLWFIEDAGFQIVSFFRASIACYHQVASPQCLNPETVHPAL